MYDKISSLLSDYGLDDKEIKVFLTLVGKKELTAYRIAKETRLNRSTTYDILERLIQKGFASRVEKGRKQFFTANDISRVISSLKDKETILLNIMPELQKIEQKMDVKVNILEGAEGQKQHNMRLFGLLKRNEIKEILIIGVTEAPSLSGQLFIDRLLQEAKSLKGVSYKAVWNAKYRGTALVEKHKALGQNKFLKDLPSRTTTIIYGNHVSFLFTTDKPHVIEIRNSLVAKEMRSYFTYLWKMSKD